MPETPSVPNTNPKLSGMAVALSPSSLPTNTETGIPIFTDEHHPQQKKLTLIPLIFLIFFEVSGGPFGEEPAVKAAGPLYTILGFLIFPFIWSIPEALVTAELATAYPGNGGYVIWASEAFGPFWGFLLGWWKFVSGVINLPAYPMLCIDYLKLAYSPLSHGWPRTLSICLSTVILSFLNYTGLTIVGWTAVFLGTVAILPFVIMAFGSLPSIKPHRWLSTEPAHKDWTRFFNTLFWNLNFWDSISTMAGEVDKPQTIFPKALFSAGIFTCLGYIIPLLAVIGSLELADSDWGNGFLAEASGRIVGRWLKFWVEAGAVLSGIGLFEAQLSSVSFQLLGMGELGILPAFVTRRSPWFNTPTFGVVVCAASSIAISFMSFNDIISSANFLYGCGMMLEFASFLWLRWRKGEVRRPYRVPMGMAGVVGLCLVPAAFIVFVMVLARKMVYAISAGVTVVGVGAYFFKRWCRLGNPLESAKPAPDAPGMEGVIRLVSGIEMADSD
ncbi:probable polyamine transporter At3g13620 [Amborella trichopoda]|uniref:Amino acid permease/ SLC12A domain-containing protein n=1 Tax=Amborella trichopoda TaxID=13333 RepID=W1NTH8_AMBTC|nr:probable polyamine transporter At3g13620 [Amborella trichopoda]ERN00792.1 hypothetical protein AMTR_s00217p00018260 [Amborella trichopoda]|eukprot:XP_006838223.1 probable polyamine transporter At3g13620 [Amborella trichopoda]